MISACTFTPEPEQHTVIPMLNEPIFSFIILITVRGSKSTEYEILENLLSIPFLVLPLGRNLAYINVETGSFPSHSPYLVFQTTSCHVP